MDKNLNCSDDKICKIPWVNCEIHDQNKLFFCCPAYCYWKDIGNLGEKSFDKIWNGKKANHFRNELLKGNTSLCDLQTCMSRHLESASEIKTKYYDKNNKVKIPSIIKISDSRECNVACITCRDEIYKRKLSRLEKKKQQRKFKNFLKIAKDLKTVDLSGTGDPFSSKYYRELIKKIVRINKTCKFGIFTNGILMTKEMCNNLGLINRMTLVSISLPGATKETYDKIVKFGNYDKVIDNIKWISSDNSICKKVLNFVIHQINYKEIPDFIELCNKYNFIPNFTHYRYWETKYGKDYETTAIWMPIHSEHQQFLEILNQDIVKQHKNHFDGMISQFIND